MKYPIEPKIGQILKISGKFCKCLNEKADCHVCCLYESNCDLVNCIGEERGDGKGIYLKEVNIEDELLNKALSAFCKVCGCQRCAERKCLEYYDFKRLLEENKIIEVKEEEE